MRKVKIKCYRTWDDVPFDVCNECDFCESLKIINGFINKEWNGKLDAQCFFSVIDIEEDVEIFTYDKELIVSREVLMDMTKEVLLATIGK